jgi:hypothetical protein
MNWMIGCIGQSKLSPRPFGSGPMLPEGTLDSHGKPVTPVSLYLAQLNERLGPAALKNIGYDSPDLTASTEPLAPARAEIAGRDLAMHRPVLASNTRDGKREFAAWQALDGDDTTYWATDDGKLPASLELDTEGALDINAVEIGEAPGLGGRVRRYKVEGFRDSAWQTLCEGTTVGQRKIDRFPRVTVWKVRLTILECDAYPAIAKFGLYLTDR